MTFRIRYVIDVGIDCQLVIVLRLAESDLQHLHDTKRPKLVDGLTLDRQSDRIAEQLPPER